MSGSGDRQDRFPLSGSGTGRSRRICQVTALPQLIVMPGVNVEELWKPVRRCGSGLFGKPPQLRPTVENGRSRAWSRLTGASTRRRDAENPRRLRWRAGDRSPARRTLLPLAPSMRADGEIHRCSHRHTVIPLLVAAYTGRVGTLPSSALRRTRPLRRPSGDHSGRAPWRSSRFSSGFQARSAAGSPDLRDRRPGRCGDRCDPFGRPPRRPT